MTEPKVSIGSENGVSISIGEREHRRCRAGHSWYSSGALYVSFGVYSGAFKDRFFQQPDVCPFCLCEKLNELCGGVVVAGPSIDGAK